jgi:prevent-host-death family protein
MTTTTYSASEARSKLYSLIREAAKGLKAFEIKLRGSEPVILMSKEELESWQETIDIMSNPKEAKAIDKARKSKKFISHEDVLKNLG